MWQPARFVERAVVARAHEAAVALERRQLVAERRRKLGRDRGIGPAQRGRGVGDLGGGRRGLSEARGDFGRGNEADLDRRKVARPATADHQAGERTGEVGRRRKPSAQIAPQREIGDEEGDGVEPRADRGRIGQGRGETLRQQARAGGAHRPVDRGGERAAALARERAHQLEVGAGRGVDRHGGALRLAHRRGERRTLADLGALHIGDAGGGRGQLEPREHAECLGRGDREIGREPPLRGRPVEHVAGERRHRRQRAQQRHHVGIAVERVRHDDLARLEPRDLRREADAVAFGEPEFAGRDVEEGEGEAHIVAGRRGARPDERDEVIVAPRVEQRILGQRARGDETHHVAPHHALRSALLRLRRVLHLLAHGDAMAERNEPVEIFVGALDRHAAHRDVHSQMLAALGQHDAERPARDLGVLEEHLVEIAHPVKEQAIRIGGLDLEILLHHGRDALVVRLGRDAVVRVSGRGKAGGIMLAGGVHRTAR